MNEKVMVNEKLKCILYTIFSNYNNLSKKIYIVLDDSKNSEKMSEDILKKINQNTPYFIKKILANFNNENDNSVLKLKKSNQYLEIVDKNQNTEGESILLDMSSLDFNDIECLYLGGGFGNYMNVKSSLQIGMIPLELDGKIKSIGNCAGSGAKMYLLSKEYRNLIVNKINTSKYIELSNRKEFQEYFVNGMMMERIYEPAQKSQTEEAAVSSI